MDAILTAIGEWLAEISQALAAAGRWIQTYRYQILTVLTGLAAAGVTANVLWRLEFGRSRQVGRRIAWLCVLLITTVAMAYGTFAGADASYVAAFSVLAAGTAIWTIVRRPHSSAQRFVRIVRIKWRRAVVRRWRWSGSHSFPHETPRAARLLLVVCVALLGVLWLVQKSVEMLFPKGVDTSDVTQSIGTIGGIGLVAMAIVQGLRTLLPVRGVFQRAVVERWIDESRDAAQSAARGWHKQRLRTTSRVLDELMALARGSIAGERYALLDLPIEQLCGQIAAGADRLLDDSRALTPAASTDGGGGAAQPASPSQESDQSKKRVIEVLSVLAAGDTDVEHFLTLATTVADRRKQGVKDPPETREYVQLRANLSQRIQRNIDRLQIQTSFWWKRALRGVAFAICGVLGLSLFKDVFPAAVCAVVGGFVATAARDLIAVVEKARR